MNKNILSGLRRRRANERTIGRISENTSANVHTNERANGRRKGFTLVELIVTLAIAAIVIGITATFLISGGNFLSNTEIKAEDKSLAETSADFVKNRLLYVNAVTVIQSDKPPEGTSGDEILYIGDASGENITNDGQLYYRRADDSSAVNAFGTGKYRSNSLAMSYRAIVKTNSETKKKTKVFEITMSTIRDGKAVYNYTKTFTLYEAADDAEPSEDMSITSWSDGEDFDDSMAKYYLLLNPATSGSGDTSAGYVTNGLMAHFDAIDNDLDSASGQAFHNPNLTNKWADISGNGKDMTLTITNINDSNPTPIRDRSIYFDGSGDSGLIPSFNLSHGPYTEGMDYGVTVEVCFREASVSKIGCLYDYVSADSVHTRERGFFMSLNSSMTGLFATSKIYTPFSGSSIFATYTWTNQNKTFTTHSNYYQMVNGKLGRRAWIDGVNTPNLVNSTGTVENPMNYKDATKDFTAYPFSIAALAYSSASNFFNYTGEIASVRIYNRLLTSKEVQQNAIEDRARFGS